MKRTGTVSWIRVPIEKDVLRKTNQRTNIHGLIHASLQLLSIGLTMALVWYSWLNWDVWMTVALIYLHGTFFSFTGANGPVHELSHQTVFASKGLNRLFLIVFSFLSWSEFSLFRKSHMQHHQYTLHKDLEQEVVVPIIIKPLDFFWYATFSLPGFIRTIRRLFEHASMRFKSPWERHLYEDDLKGKKEVARWARFLLLGHTAILLISAFTGLWQLFILISLGSFYANWLSALCGYTQHTGLPGEVDDFRLCCRTVLLNPLFRFYYWNMNYHIEHHMYASVPYHKLPRLHKILKEDLPESPKGLLAAWKIIRPAVIRQREDPAFTLTQSLPTKAVQSQ